MIQEKSCGALIVRNSGPETEVLLVQHQNGMHWGFPKGHVEHGETEHETALREIREETGLEVNLLDGFREEDYFSPYPGAMKTVVYFLAIPATAELTRQESEIHSLKWFSADEADKHITFPRSREILKLALAHYRTLT